MNKYTFVSSTGDFVFLYWSESLVYATLQQTLLLFYQTAVMINHFLLQATGTIYLQQAGVCEYIYRNILEF